MSIGADQELLYLPLGGVGEIGMNLSLYGHAGKWLMVDLGISFADEALPGIDVIMPDPSFIAERCEQLAGLVLTHAHEDHLGAVAYLWPQLRCPVYATPFAASVLRNKLHEAGLTNSVPLHEVRLGETVQIGPFSVEYVAVTHSIPEPASLAIRTKAGLVIHTGDWKLDPQPLIGGPADEARFRALGDEGVLALISDSTNVFREAEAGSESAVRDSMMELVGTLKQRVAVACFATNLARVETLAKVAMAHDRHVGLVGRSLWRINEAARRNGYLTDVPAFLSDHDAAYLPRDKVLLICTGSQGEPVAAMNRIAADDHPHIVLERGDTVIFSSRIIPGNDIAIGRLQNRLVKRGIEIITEKDKFVHVSGHPGRSEMRRLYEWTRPKLAVPVHGEARHLAAHAVLAREMGALPVVIENGMMLSLAPGKAEVIDTVPVGRLARDGTRLVRTDSPLLRSRHRMIYNGLAVVTVAVDLRGLLAAPPQLTLQGLLDPEADAELWREVEVAVAKAVNDLAARDRRDDEAVREAARLAVRRTLRKALGKKPTTEVHLIRLTS